MSYYNLSGIKSLSGGDEYNQFASGTFAFPCVCFGKWVDTYTRAGYAITLTFIDGTTQVITDADGQITTGTAKYATFYFPSSTSVWLSSASKFSTVTPYDKSLLVYDRVQADVNRAKALFAKGYGNLTTAEKTEWDNGLKGSWNVADFTRVGNATNYAGTLSTLCGTRVTGRYTFSPWSVQYYQEYYTTLTALNAAAQVSSASLPTTSFNMRYDGVNAIERNVYDTITALEAILQGIVDSNQGA